MLDGAEAPVGLLAGDFDAEHRSDLGVLGDLGWCRAQFSEQRLAVHHRAVALDVGGAEQVALHNLVAAEAGVILDRVFDCVSLLCEQADLGQQRTEGVNAVGQGNCCHDSLSVLVAALSQWLQCNRKLHPSVTFYNYFLGSFPSRTSVLAVAFHVLPVAIRHKVAYLYPYFFAASVALISLACKR